MSTTDIIRSILELAVIVFTIWGLFHEDKFIVFEDKIAALFRRRSFRVINGGYHNTSSHKAEKIS